MCSYLASTLFWCLPSLVLLLLLLFLLQDMYKDESGSVIEFDLYHAESLLPLSDDALITHLLQTYLTPALPRGLSQAQTLTVKDSSVLRFRNAVTRFSPGSNSYLPGITTSIPSVFVAGDCVKQGPGSHGCKGLSQEKAYVSGLQVRCSGMIAAFEHRPMYNSLSNYVLLLLLLLLLVTGTCKRLALEYWVYEWIAAVCIVYAGWQCCSSRSRSGTGSSSVASRA